MLALYTDAHENLYLSKASYNGAVLSDFEEILVIDEVPYNQGHELSMMNDGSILVSVGTYDGTNPSRRDNLNGKIIRLDIDGNAISDNPLYDELHPDAPVSYIYSLGHRKAAAMVQIPETHPTLANAVYNVEPGANGGDEINLIHPGADHGWRRISGYCEEEIEGFICPKATFSLVPSSMVFYNHTAIPDWTHTFLIGTLNLYGGLIVADLEQNGEIGNVDVTRDRDDVMLVDENRRFHFISDTDVQRVKDVAVGADGRVYVAVSEDNVETRGRVVVLENPAIHTPVSVNEEATAQLGFTFGPNPMSDVLRVNLNNSSQSNWNARLVNMLGESVVDALGTEGSVELELDVSSISSGAYMLIVETNGLTQAVPVVR